MTSKAQSGRSRLTRAQRTWQDLAKQAKGTKPSKYKAVRCEVDGEKFDSKKEMRRWSELKLLQNAGVIRELSLQMPFALHVFTPEGRLVSVGEYRCDFNYYIVKTGERIVEDVKADATKTAVYRLKKRIVEAQYGVKILET